MMVSNLAFTIVTLTCRTPPIAFARSASIPTTVFPFEAMNSFGA